MRSAPKILAALLPFWLYLAFFKFGGGLHYTLMSPYGELFFPIWVVGALIGAGSLIQLLFDVPAGYLLDRFGYVRMLKITTAAFFLASLSIAFGLTQVSYLLSLALAVLGWQFYGPGGSAYILSRASDAESGRYFSLRESFGSIGIVLSSVSLPFVLLLSPSAAGTLLCVLFGMSLVLLYFVPKEEHPVLASHMPHHSRRQHTSRFADIVYNIRRLNPASGLLMLLTFSAAVFYGIIWFVVPLVIAKQQANADLMGFGLAVFDFSVVALGYLLGKLADKTNKRALVFFGLLTFSLFGFLVGLNFGWLFILFGFLATTGDETAEISLWSWMHHLDKDHTADGSVSAVISFFEDLGWAIGPAVAGILYTLVGPGLSISIGAIPIFIVWVVYYLFMRSSHRALENSLSLASIALPRKPLRRRHKQ